MTRSHFALFALVAMMTTSMACAPEADDQGSPNADASSLTHDNMDDAQDRAVLDTPTTPQALRCETPGVPVLESLTAQWNPGGGSVAIQLQGLHCDAEIQFFEYQLSDGEGPTDAGRMWLDQMETFEDGRFLINSTASRCRSILRGEDITLFIPLIEGGESTSNSVTAPIAPSQEEIQQ